MPLTTLRRALLLGATLWLVGCATPDLRLSVSSNAVLNQDTGSDSLPVRVRIYQLTTLQSFENADFEELWKDDLGVLASDLVMREEFIMEPADQRRLVLTRHDQAAYVAVVALFRDPSDTGWRDSLPLGGNFVTRRFNTNLRIALEGNRLALER